jgi:hypothetical protein
MIRAFKALRNGKSRCVDNIPVKLMQSGGISVVEDIWKTMKLIWQTEQMPTEWKMEHTRKEDSTVNKGTLHYCAQHTNC